MPVVESGPRADTEGMKNATTTTTATDLTKTQAEALDLLRDTEDVGQASSGSGPATFAPHGPRMRRLWPTHGANVSTYRVLVAKGYAAAAEIQWGGCDATQFSALPQA